MKKVGVLVHGLFLQANEWEQIVWGEPPHRLGSLPKAVEIMLLFGLDNIGHVVFGTGASEKEGVKEAEYTNLQLQLAIKSRRLEAYPSIATRHDFQSTRGLVLLSTLIQSATREVEAKNTADEIKNAAKHFAEKGCDFIVHIPTCGSHAPRCVKTLLQVKAQGGIPEGQVWTLAAPDTTFADSTIADVAIVEPPHRADDPMVQAPVKAHQVIARLFKMSPQVRKKFLSEADAILRETYKV